MHHAHCSLSLPPLPFLPPSLSLLSHLFPGGTTHSTNDQLNVSPRGGGAGGSAVVAGDSSTLAPGSGLLNVSKSHKRSQSEGAIHRYMYMYTCIVHVEWFFACICTCTYYIFRIYCTYYRSELESPSAGDRALNKGKRSYWTLIIFLTFDTFYISHSQWSWPVVRKIWRNCYSTSNSSTLKVHARTCYVALSPDHSHILFIKNVGADWGWGQGDIHMSACVHVFVMFLHMDVDN